jgi:hypothetical protein
MNSARAQLTTPLQVAASAGLSPSRLETKRGVCSSVASHPVAALEETPGRFYPSGPESLVGAAAKFPPRPRRLSLA